MHVTRYPVIIFPFSEVFGTGKLKHSQESKNSCEVIARYHLTFWVFLKTKQTFTLTYGIHHAFNEKKTILQIV